MMEGELFRPLVRIDLLEGKSAEFRRKIGGIIYQTPVDVINIPPQDKFQVITEHDENSLIFDPKYVNIQRTDGFVLIQFGNGIAQYVT